MPSYEYPRPALTADMVVFDPRNRVLLIRRSGEPFAGCWALPGGFVDEGESARQAALRELSEEAGLRVADRLLVEIGAFTEPGRDPRGWTVSVAFAVCASEYAVSQAKAGDDASEFSWFRLSELPELAFDHAEILARAQTTMLGD